MESYKPLWVVLTHVQVPELLSCIFNRTGNTKVENLFCLSHPSTQFCREKSIINVNQQVFLEDLVCEKFFTTLKLNTHTHIHIQTLSLRAHGTCKN